MQTITTKYLGATNYRGARIKASTTGGVNKTVSYNDEKSGIKNHEWAIHELNLKLAWSGELVAGSPDKSGDSYIWVFVDGSDRVELLPF